VTRDDLQVIQADVDLEDLEHRVDRLLSSDKFGLFIADEELLCSFYDDLIAPILPHIKGKQRLCILPDDKLHYLPFQALRDSDRGSYLVEEFAVYTAPSLSALDWLRRMGTYGRREILAFGDPLFTEVLHEPREIAFRDALHGELLPLPATKLEVQAIEEVYQQCPCPSAAPGQREQLQTVFAGLRRAAPGDPRPGQRGRPHVFLHRPHSRQG